MFYTAYQRGWSGKPQETTLDPYTAALQILAGRTTAWASRSVWHI